MINIPNNNRLEYVASGISFSKMTDRDEKFPVEDYIARWCKTANENSNHKFSILYNSFTEKTLGQEIRKDFGESIHKVYGDSGGLQIMSRNMKITPELKQEVYKNQSDYCDLGMCFDEIPVKRVNENVFELDNSSKVFYRELLEPMAKETAKNIIEQIELFNAQKSKCEPIAIIQGNCIETAKIWCDVLYKEIPKDLHQYIAGFAMGSSGIGSGELEEVKKLMWVVNNTSFSNSKQIHLLGVGTSIRFAPTIVMMKSGLINNSVVSYDSTTHTRSNILGRYYFSYNGSIPKKINYNRAYSPIYEAVFKDVISHFPDVLDFCKTSYEYYEMLNSSPIRWQEKTGEKHPVILAFASHAIGCCINFMNHIDSMVFNENDFNDVVDIRRGNKIDRSKRVIYNGLSEVKNMEDFRYWETHLGSKLPSKPVRNGLSTLEDFF